MYILIDLHCDMIKRVSVALPNASCVCVCARDVYVCVGV